MKVKKAHCFFEQSGTFKKEFMDLGVEAIDYDILDDFGKTDHVIDLFAEIEKAYVGEPSVFDTIEKDDLIISFFPCDRFEAKVPLSMRCQTPSARKFEPTRKLEYTMKLAQEQARNYQLWCKMFHVVYTRGLRMIVENPYTAPQYLNTYFCIQPTIVDTNRRLRGDYQKKPTQYWFIGCEPEANIIMEPLEYVEQRVNDWTHGENRKRIRSSIHPQYARRFIREFILDKELDDGK